LHSNAYADSVTHSDSDTNGDAWRNSYADGDAWRDSDSMPTCSLCGYRSRSDCR
jgi:hypothetical protein